ncbi:hypothetical protein B6U93_01700 [Candidatus Woesearchaeota archaeon ex4484_78]|nr:MAG: hypothetical protein B6U93_01700 [Candidatus Woesearchaeota archaeon ex4484_78]
MLETILAIPILGAMIILFSFWLLLPVEIALGIIGLMMSKKAKTKKTGHILQIITGCIAWIPFIGWIMHLISAITLWLEWKKI